MKYLTTLMILICGFATTLASAEQTGTISSVIVYPDRAAVTRELTATLVPGDNAIVFNGLPLNIDLNSLRVRGEGPAGMKVGAVEITPAFFAETQQENVRKIESELEDKANAIAELSGRVTIAQAQQEYFKALRAKVIESAQNEMSGAKVSVENYRSTAEYAFNGLAESLTMERQAGIDRMKLEKEIQKLQNELAQLKGGTGKALQTATVQVVSEKSGTCRLELDYIVPGASWVPVYEARYSPSTDEIEWTYGAVVQQSTGENWNDAALALSTARPALGAGAPELSPWILNPYVQETRKRDKSAGYAQAPMAKMSSEADGAFGREMAVSDEVMPAEPIQAAVVDSGMAMQFAIPGKITIPSGKAVKQVTVAVHRFKATYEYHATPRLSEFVFMTAKVKNETATPFLAGQVRAFHGNEFVGVIPLKQIAVNEEVEIPLGADPRIEIKRTTLHADRSPAGLFGGKVRWNYSYQNELKSHLKHPVEVVVHEQIPVSRDSRLTVFDIATKPKAEDADAEGLFEWKQTLAPDAKLELTLTFNVEHPEDMIVSGL